MSGDSGPQQDQEEGEEGGTGASDQRLRHSGIPHLAVRLAGRLPGRVGRDTSGTLANLRQMRFVGLAAELAYFMTLGLIPLAVAVLALIGLVRPLLGPEGELAIEAAFEYLAVFHLRGQTQELALDGITRLLDGGALGLLIPIIVTSYASVRGFTGAMRGLGSLYGTEAQRPHWRDALATLGFTGIAAVLGVFAAFAALLEPVAGGALLEAFLWARWVIVPAGLLVFLVTLYHYVHGWEYRWRNELPGAVLATVGIVGAAAGYAAYLSSGPELGLGPFFGAMVGGSLATLGLMYGFAALMLLGGAYNAWLAHGEDLDRGAR